MAKYLFAYTGGGTPESEEAQAAVMAAWTAWFEKLGAAIVDPGNPIGPSATVAGDGAVSPGGKGGLTGYSVITADDLDAATAMAKGCPVLADGGSVEVYETFDVM
jgi:hypothetical protein